MAFAQTGDFIVKNEVFKQVICCLGIGGDIVGVDIYSSLASGFFQA